MEGSPARGQKMDGLAALLIDLNGAPTLSDFQGRLLQGLAANLQHGGALVILRRPASDDLDFENLKTTETSSPISSSWLKSHLDRHPELPRKLRHGEIVGITHVDGRTTPQPVTNSRRNVLLSPIILKETIVGVIGLVLQIEALQRSEDEVELIRQVSHFAAPVIVRLEELERLRTDRRENEALQAILEMQTHLQSNIAHELRTPLATVRGYTRMILDGRVGEIPQTQRDYLNIVTENANRLISLVNWMSYVLQYGLQHLKVETANMEEIWAACLKSKQSKLDDKSITVKQQIPSDAFITTCDRGKMEYVFTSLLANAIRCTPNGGHIAVEFSRGRQREITFKIADFGEGLPPEQVNKIFERYYGASFSAANPTDMGLAGVYDIIGLHGGRLFVNSRTGEGSTFLFTLPAVRQESEEKIG